MSEKPTLIQGGINLLVKTRQILPPYAGESL